MFTEKDLQQIQNHGLDIDNVKVQIERFKQGYPKLDIVAPATIDEGISKFEKDDEEKYIELYERKQKKNKIIKFVPASGAATRMFKKIFEILNAYDGSEEKYLELLVDRSPNSIFYTCENMQDFAFYEDLQIICKDKGECIESKFEKKDYVGALRLIVSEKGLNYSHYPKGLIKFHKYKNNSRTATEEHLVEGAMYGASGKDVYVHFTVAPEHTYNFEKHLEQVIPRYEEQFDVKFHYELSVQKKKTDTIAVTPNNEPYRNKEGDLVFRPGGHGSLIENLNDIDADVVFIKNIDNVVTDRLKPITAKYKKLLGGVLIDARDKVFKYIDKLENDDDISDSSLTKIANYAQSSLNIHITNSFKDLPKPVRIEHLKNVLNRPIRVCGMVKNEDEPGGGPFWVENTEGLRSLQIVESSQFDFNDKKQKKIFESATHFNPVDIVCSIKNKNGNKFDLTNFTDTETGFIASKSIEGDNIKALEHPGLWNGGMAKWITIFVEVPMETFNPVKMLNDLLRKEHIL